MEIPTKNVALAAEHKNLQMRNSTLVTKDDFALDITCSQHAVHDCTVFTFYKILDPLQDIKGYVESLKAIETSQILLLCNANGKCTKFGFTKVLHVPDTPINLIFYRQLDGICSMRLVSNGISVGTEEIIA